MNFTLTWNIGARDKILQAPNKIIKATAYQMMIRTQEITPKRTGDLRKSALNYGVKETGNSYIIANTMSYSASTYRGYYNGHLIRNWTTPGTGAYWYNKMWRQQGIRIVKYAVAQNILK